MKAPGKR